MRVNIGGGAHITVTEIPLNDLHIHVKRHEERRAGVAQIVEADIPHSVLLEELRKVRRKFQIMWENHVSI